MRRGGAGGVQWSLSPRHSRGGNSGWGVEDGFEGIFMKKFGAIIGEGRLEFTTVGAQVTAKSVNDGSHGGLGNRWAGVHIETAGLSWSAAVGADKGEDVPCRGPRRAFLRSPRPVSGECTDTMQGRGIAERARVCVLPELLGRRSTGGFINSRMIR